MQLSCLALGMQIHASDFPQVHFSPCPMYFKCGDDARFPSCTGKAKTTSLFQMDGLSQINHSSSAATINGTTHDFPHLLWILQSSCKLISLFSMSIQSYGINAVDGKKKKLYSPEQSWGWGYPNNLFFLIKRNCLLMPSASYMSKKFGKVFLFKISILVAF